MQIPGGARGGMVMAKIDNCINRLILKVTKSQPPPSKHLGTVVKNILGGHHGPPCQIGLIELDSLFETSC